MIKKLYKKIKIQILKNKGIKIGKNTDIINSFLDETHPHLIKIGNNCTLTNCTLLTHDASIKKQLGYSKIGRISIGDNCFIGYGTIILPNVKIGNNCIVGAGSVVTKDLPDNSIAVGNPCKIIRNTTDFFEKYKKKIKESNIIFNRYYRKMNKRDRNIQYDKLKNGGIGYDL